MPAEKKSPIIIDPARLDSVITGDDGTPKKKSVISDKVNKFIESNISLPYVDLFKPGQESANGSYFNFPTFKDVMVQIQHDILSSTDRNPRKERRLSENLADRRGQAVMDTAGGLLSMFSGGLYPAVKHGLRAGLLVSQKAGQIIPYLAARAHHASQPVPIDSHLTKKELWAKKMAVKETDNIMHLVNFYATDMFEEYGWKVEPPGKNWQSQKRKEIIQKRQYFIGDVSRHSGDELYNDLDGLRQLEVDDLMKKEVTKQKAKKAAFTVAGIAGDFLLDPTTYCSFGASAAGKSGKLLKNGIRNSVNHADDLLRLGEKVGFELAEEFSDDVAKALVKKITKELPEYADEAATAFKNMVIAREVVRKNTPIVSKQLMKKGYKLVKQNKDEIGKILLTMSPEEEIRLGFKSFGIGLPGMRVYPVLPEVQAKLYKAMQNGKKMWNAGKGSMITDVFSTEISKHPEFNKYFDAAFQFKTGQYIKLEDYGNRSIKRMQEIISKHDIKYADFVNGMLMLEKGKYHPVHEVDDFMNFAADLLENYDAMYFAELNSLEKSLSKSSFNTLSGVPLLRERTMLAKKYGKTISEMDEIVIRLRNGEKNFPPDILSWAQQQSKIKDDVHYYLPRILTEKGRKWLKKKHELGISLFGDPIETRVGGLKRSSFGDINPSQLGRVHPEKTLLELNDRARSLGFKGDLFHTDPTLQYVMRRGRSQDAIANMRLFKMIRDNPELAIEVGEAGKKAPAVIIKDGVKYRKFKAPSDVQVKILDDMYVPEEIHNSLSKMVSKSDWDDFLRFYDKLLGFWKMMTLTPFPSYHFRNFIGNSYNAWLGGCSNPMRYIDAGKIENYIASDGKHYSDFIFKTKSGEAYTAKKIKELVTGHAVRGGGFFNSEVAPDQLQKTVQMLAWKGTKGGGLKRANPLRFYMRKMELFGSAVEDNARIGLFLDRLYKGDAPEIAAKHVNKYLFDYRKSTPTMKSMARIAPFYKWSRYNIPLQITEAIKQPWKYRLINDDILPNINRAFEDEIEEGGLTKWQQDQSILQVGEDSYVSLESYMPSSDINRAGLNALMQGDIRKAIQQTSTAAYGMVSPFIKTPIELLLNKNGYFQNEISQYEGQHDYFLGKMIPKEVSTVIRQFRPANELNRLNPGSMFGDRHYDPTPQERWMRFMIGAKLYKYTASQTATRNIAEIYSEVRAAEADMARKQKTLFELQSKNDRSFAVQRQINEYQNEINYINGIIEKKRAKMAEYDHLVESQGDRKYIGTYAKKSLPVIRNMYVAYKNAVGDTQKTESYIMSPMSRDREDYLNQIVTVKVKGTKNDYVATMTRKDAYMTLAYFKATYENLNSGMAKQNAANKKGK